MGRANSIDRLWGGSNLALAAPHGSVIVRFMRLVPNVAIIIGGILALNFAGCRSKPKRPTQPKPSASVVTPAAADAGAPSANLAHFEPKAVEIGEFSTLRQRVLFALKGATSKTIPPNDSLVALAQALTDAPGSAVLAVELVRAAARARDQRRLQRYMQIAQHLTEGQPNLSKALGAIKTDKATKPKRNSHDDASSPSAAPRPAQKIADGTDFDTACIWLKKSFAEGRPPVDDIGSQGTDSVDCQLLSPYSLTPEIRAVPVVVAARGAGERMFAWIAAAYKGGIWLSTSLVENFAPSFHPFGNGFSIELQRAAAYHAGLPELSAYISERSTQIDVALNEQVTIDRHRIVVMTFDLEPPRTSPSVVLHSRIERSLVDATDNALPKGYQHSADVGKVVEQTYQLQWGNNRVILTATGQAGAKPIEQVLFAE